MTPLLYGGPQTPTGVVLVWVEVGRVQGEKGGVGGKTGKSSLEQGASASLVTDRGEKVVL